MEYKDYYKIMGVARDASAEDIKRAHRKLARRFHPDVSKEPDAQARFQELSEAYEVLRDPDKRSEYDHLGRHWRAGQDFRPPPASSMGRESPGRGFEGGFDGGGRHGHSAGEFSDFFEAMFGREFQGAGFAGRPLGSGARARRRGQAGQRGQDHHAGILIDLRDAYQGARRQVRLERSDTPAGSPGIHEIHFEVPKGIRPGQRIRLAGQGGPGSGGEPAGDLFLEVAFRPPGPGEPAWRVEQHDVYLDLPIAPWEAALGASVQAPTPTGWVELRIPAQSPAGRKLRLKGRGLPASTPGDLYFVLQLSTPPAQTEAQRQLYRDMAAQFTGYEPRAAWGPP